MEFHPDPAEEEEEMRPLHLVLRNVPGEGGLRGREGGQRRGDCLEVCVSILSRSLPVFLEIKVGRGGTGRTSSRPADASSEQGVGRLLLHQPLGQPASPPPFRPPRGLRTTRGQRRTWVAPGRAATCPQRLGKGRPHEDIWPPWGPCQGLSCARDAREPAEGGILVKSKAPEPG